VIGAFSLPKTFSVNASIESATSERATCFVEKENKVKNIKSLSFLN